MNALGIEFELDQELNVWKSTTKIAFLGDELEIWLSAEGDSDFDQQSEILSYAIKLLPQREEEAKQRLFEFYKEACENFDDLVGTELLPIVDSPDLVNLVFGFSVLVVPEQMPGRGSTFKVVGGCSWNANDGTQLFFRDGSLEQVDSDAAFFT